MADTPGAPELGSSEPSKAPMLFALLNTLGILAAVGALVYTRVLFKRPPITESGERSRLADEVEKTHRPTKTGTVSFDPVTVNIRSNPEKPALAEGTSKQIGGKLHYATIGFVLEIRDEARGSQVGEVKPLLMDRFLHLLGNKAFHELNTVQGRYVLRTQIQDMANQLIAERGKTDEEKAPLVINVYLTQFTVQ